MSFVEERLLDCVAYGTQGGPTRNTKVAELRNGMTTRNARWSRPKHRYVVLYNNLKEEDQERVIAAHNACDGRRVGFRLKDWSDYQASGEALAVGTGSEQTVQLQKVYTFGSLTHARPIRKPVVGTVVLSALTAPTGVSINYTTGMATFTASPGQQVTWSGEFDVPVTFEQDALSFEFVSKAQDGQFFLTADVALIEDFTA